MADLRFGAFLAPHHPIGENPTLQIQSDLEFVEHLERLGYDEFWCGEHHSTGWEIDVACPHEHDAMRGAPTYGALKAIRSGAQNRHSCI